MTRSYEKDGRMKSQNSPIFIANYYYNSQKYFSQNNILKKSNTFSNPTANSSPMEDSFLHRGWRVHILCDILQRLRFRTTTRVGQSG